MLVTWRSSPRWWRVVMAFALAWGGLRLGLQIYLFLSPMSDQIGVDLQEAYLVAGRRFLTEANLYPATIEAMEGLYFYAPPVALAFTPLLWLPEKAALFIGLAICLTAYAGLFLTWRRIFTFLGLEKARRALLASLPLWMVFSAFWDDATYLNIYTLMAFLGSLFIEAILRERLFPASLYLAVILATKPQWAFALALPLLLGKARFFWKLLAGALTAYVGLVAISVAFSSPTYILDQYRNYLSFLIHLTPIHPWRTAAADGFLGYNHSIVQVFVFLGGEKARWAGQLVKYLLLLAGGVLLARDAWRRRGRAAGRHGEECLTLTFTLYLMAFLWLDLLWELYLTIVIYPFLVSLDLSRRGRVLAGIVFLPYALLDVWRMIVYALGSPLIQEAYLAWDFSAYLPLVLLVGLVFYFLLLRRVQGLDLAGVAVKER